MVRHAPDASLYLSVWTRENKNNGENEKKQKSFAGVLFLFCFGNWDGNWSRWVEVGFWVVLPNSLGSEARLGGVDPGVLIFQIFFLK